MLVWVTKGIESVEPQVNALDIQGMWHVVETQVQPQLKEEIMKLIVDDSKMLEDPNERVQSHHHLDMSKE
jgi:hypothetical protein